MMKKLIVLAAVCSFALAIYQPGTVSSSNADKNPVTFAKQVAPIFQKRCEECHREGGMAPMSLATYEESRPWARAIKEKVAIREMPPFHAAGAVGRYLNDPRLTDEEIATIVKWVDGGAPKGDLARFMANETRFGILKNVAPERALELAGQAQEQVHRHYAYYQQLATPSATVTSSAPAVAAPAAKS